MYKHLPLFIIGFFAFYLSSEAQTDSQIQRIRQSSNLDKLSALKQDYLLNRQTSKREALEMAKIKNWPVTIEKDGHFMELQRITRSGQPLYFTTYTSNTAKSTRTNFLHNGGGLGLNLEGQNMTAHIWDVGLAMASHQEYDGIGGTDRFSIGDETTKLNYHSAHVTGIIIASGVDEKSQGMAPQAKVVGYDWNNDIAEATVAAEKGMLISNHSYGYVANQVPDEWFGAYNDDAHEWDELMFNAPYYLMVKAAGNDGDDETSNTSPLDGNKSFDKLFGSATAKNNLVVANAQDAILDSEGNLISVNIYNTSSEGPTDDYRIKPDITGNGTSVYSTLDSSDTAYGSLTGTSMASPNVAGSLLLLQQHYNNLNDSFMYAATLKGLALHTADDAGISGPDAIYGWGLLNAKKAVEVISNNNNKSFIKELVLVEGQTYTLSVKSDNLNALRASICWTDPAGNLSTSLNSKNPALVNDLDIRISNGTTYFPYKLTSLNTNGVGDNNVDPFELVNIENASGEYTITITHKGSLTDGYQKVSLIVTGIINDGVCTAEIPTNILTGGINDTYATVYWDNIASATYDLKYRPVGTSEWITNTHSISSVSLTGLSPETQYEVQVRSICNDGTTSDYSSSIYFTTLATPLVYCESSSKGQTDEYIQTFQLNTINNSSDIQNGYSDYTDVSTTLNLGQTYEFTIIPKWSGVTYKEGYSIWIDYNHDGDFDDKDELVWNKAPSNETIINGTFTVPENCEMTTTRLRVSMKFNTIPESCDIFNYGEVEDYTVVLEDDSVDTEAPSAPLNLQADSISETSIDLSWTDSTDNVGVKEYKIYCNNVFIGSATNTEFQVQDLSENTAYSFIVHAIDEAGNTSESSNELLITTLVILPNGCINEITSYPYNQGFENTLGQWQQSTADDFDWTLKSGSTSSSNTGPSSAVEGSYYLYLEATNPVSTTKKAIFTSPCFDFSDETELSLSFKYHMYGGTDMGNLSFEVSTDNGENWLSLWFISGNQGDHWNEVEIDLNDYLGGTAQFRFNGETGTTWQSDIAIDAFKISSKNNDQCIAATLKITFDNYPEETKWDIKDVNGAIIFYGGTYDAQTDGSSIEIPLCMEEGCYTFTMYDTYGDGMCCQYGNGSFSLSKDDDGTELASGGLFTDSVITEFCLEGENSFITNVQKSEVIEDVTVYPNPAKDFIQVSLKDSKMYSYMITNSFGQLVKQSDLSNKTIDVSQLKSGVYIINFYSDKKVQSEKLIIE